MGLRYQNIDDYWVPFDAINIFGGADVALSPRPPFRGKVVGFRAVISAVLDANNVDIKIQRVSDSVDLTQSLNVASADALGRVLSAAGTDATFDAGQELKADLTENGAVGAGAVQLWLLLRKLEPGNVWENAPRT